MINKSIPEFSDEIMLEECFFSANLTALFELEEIDEEPVTAANDASYENLYGRPGAA